MTISDAPPILKYMCMCCFGRIGEMNVFYWRVSLNKCNILIVWKIDYFLTSPSNLSKKSLVSNPLVKIFDYFHVQINPHSPKR